MSTDHASVILNTPFLSIQRERRVAGNPLINSMTKQGRVTRTVARRGGQSQQASSEARFKAWYNHAILRSAEPAQRPEASMAG